MSGSCEPTARARARLLVGWASLFVLWTLATWWLEGRIRTLLRPEAVADRLAYVVVANLLVGVLASALLVRAARRSAGERRPGSPLRTAVATAAGIVLGGGLMGWRGLPSAQPWVIVNAYAQVLSVTVAEVAVCWWALEAALRAWRPRARVGSAVVTVLVGAPAFGLYHFGHSPPFDTWSMVGLLTVVGIFTGCFYVVSRDVYGTVVFHNFAGTLGVTDALARADRLGDYEEPLVPTLAMGAVALGILVLGDGILARGGAKAPSPESTPHSARS